MDFANGLPRKNYLEVKSENVTKFCTRCGDYHLFKVMENDHSNIIKCNYRSASRKLQR